MFVFQRKEFIAQLVLRLTLVASSFLFLFFPFFHFVMRSVDHLPHADHLLEDLAKFGHKAERDMKLKTFERLIFQASCWYIIHKSGIFLGLFYWNSNF